MISANGSYTSNKDREINQQKLNEYYLEQHKKKNPQAVKTMVKMKESSMLHKRRLSTMFTSSNIW